MTTITAVAKFTDLDFALKNYICILEILFSLEEAGLIIQVGENRIKRNYALSQCKDDIDEWANSDFFMNEYQPKFMSVNLDNGAIKASPEGAKHFFEIDHYRIVIPKLTGH